jgi:hypothetical protein
MGMLRVLSRRGDDRVVWDARGVAVADPEAVAAVEVAERRFRDEQARGTTAFRVERSRAPVRIDRFDPNAEQIVLVPRVVGGER